MGRHQLTPKRASFFPTKVYFPNPGPNQALLDTVGRKCSFNSNSTTGKIATIVIFLILLSKNFAFYLGGIRKGWENYHHQLVYLDFSCQGVRSFLIPLSGNRQRMEAVATVFVATFLKDVITVVRRQLVYDPWNLVVDVNVNDVVNDPALSSRVYFVTICGDTKQKLATVEQRMLLHAIRDAAKNQDYTVSIDLMEGTATLDFTRAEQNAEQRRAESAKWRGSDSIVRILTSSQESLKNNSPKKSPKNNQEK